jgi:hypothetical protein
MVADTKEEAKSRQNMIVGTTGMITREGSGLRIGSCISWNT